MNTLRKTLVRATLALLGAAAFACTSRIANFTVISTRPVPWKPEVVGRGVGEDLCSLFFTMPVPAFANPRGYPSDTWAVDKALEFGNGNLLIEADLESWFWTAYFYGEWTADAEGQVARIGDSRSAPASRPARP